MTTTKSYSRLADALYEIQIPIHLNDMRYLSIMSIFDNQYFVDSESPKINLRSIYIDRGLNSKSTLIDYDIMPSLVFIDFLKMRKFNHFRL